MCMTHTGTTDLWGNVLGYNRLGFSTAAHRSWLRDMLGCYQVNVRHSGIQGLADRHVRMSPG